MAPLRQPVAPLPLVGTISGGVQPPERYVAERDIVARLTFDGVQLQNIMLHMLRDEWPEIVESMPEMEQSWWELKQADLIQCLGGKKPDPNR